ncbi:MAG TPA: nucleoside 2-deoxyribosyltransferase [Solirubrobacterales bacterium]|nr:nucleoside 2-deoxyribosyltransferase [Solirubrobacterales bacterium]
MTPGPRCYIASPLGFSEAGRHYYAEVLLPALSQLVEPVDPWALVSDQEIAAALDAGTEKEFAAEIGRRNKEALESCRLLVAVLDGQEIDSGTAAEVGYASALGLVCLGLRTDHRQSGERGATVNLQVESFLIASGGGIADSLDALIADLRRAVQKEGAGGRSAE